MTIAHFKNGDRVLEDIGSGAKMAWDVDSDVSSELGCAVSEFENGEFEWTVNYDEYLHCISGRLTVETREGDFALDPGDGLFVPKGTQVVYKAGARTRVLVSVYRSSAPTSSGVI